MSADDRLPNPEVEPTISVERAGRAAYDLGRAASYNAAARGDIPTIRVGARLRVPTALLREQLGLPTIPANAG